MRPFYKCTARRCYTHSNLPPNVRTVRTSWEQEELSWASFASSTLLLVAAAGVAWLVGRSAVRFLDPTSVPTRPILRAQPGLIHMLATKMTLLTLLLIGVGAEGCPAGTYSVDFSSATSIFIEVPDILSLAEVEARDTNGNRIAPASATMSSTSSSASPAYPASKCIDEVTNSVLNMCRTSEADSNPWLRIDYPSGALSALNELVIYNRVGW